MVSFQSQLQPSQVAAAAAAAQLMAQPRTAEPVQHQQPPAHQAGPPQSSPPEAYQQAPHTQPPEQQQWYSGVYQPPAEVPTIGSLPAYGVGPYDLWAVKLDVDDPSMQMPSARIDAM
jgi:hypothetical protein